MLSFPSFCPEHSHMSNLASLSSFSMTSLSALIVSTSSHNFRSSWTTGFPDKVPALPAAGSASSISACNRRTQTNHKQNFHSSWTTGPPARLPHCQPLVVPSLSHPATGEPHTTDTTSSAPGPQGFPARISQCLWLVLSTLLVPAGCPCMRETWSARTPLPPPWPLQDQLQGHPSPNITIHISPPLHQTKRQQTYRWLGQQRDGILVLLILFPHNLISLDGCVEDGAVLLGLLSHGLGQRLRGRATPPLLELLPQLLVWLLFIIQWLQALGQGRQGQSA